MTLKGGVWGEAQPSQPSPTSPAEAGVEMGSEQDGARAASAEPEITSRPTATPTALPSPTPVADAPPHGSKRAADPTDANVPTDTTDGPVDDDEEPPGEVDDRG
eukprot:9733349-Karenia_brevis.AAC.1